MDRRLTNRTVAVSLFGEAVLSLRKGCPATWMNQKSLNGAKQSQKHLEKSNAETDSRLGEGRENFCHGAGVSVWKGEKCQG